MSLLFRRKARSFGGGGEDGSCCALLLSFCWLELLPAAGATDYRCCCLLLACLLQLLAAPVTVIPQPPASIRERRLPSEVGHEERSLFTPSSVLSSGGRKGTSPISAQATDPQACIESSYKK